MSAVATRESRVRRGDAHVEHPHEQRLFEPQGPSLESTIVDVWRELAAGEPVTCPVCTGEMSAGGRCHSCGSELT
jgi:hypothetical protein